MYKSKTQNDKDFLLGRLIISFRSTSFPGILKSPSTPRGSRHQSRLLKESSVPGTGKINIKNKNNITVASTKHPQEASKTLLMHSTTPRVSHPSKNDSRPRRPRHHHHHLHKGRHHHNKKSDKKSKKARRDYPLDYYSTNTPLWRLTGFRNSAIAPQYNTRQYINQVGNYNSQPTSNLYTGGANFVNPGGNPFYGFQQQQQQQQFYQGQNAAASFANSQTFTTNDRNTNTFAGLNILSKKTIQNGGVGLLKQQSVVSPPYQAGSDIMSPKADTVKNSALRSKAQSPVSAVPHEIVKKTNIPLRPTVKNIVSVSNGNTKVLPNGDTVSYATYSPTTGNKKNVMTANFLNHPETQKDLQPNAKETKKEKDQILSEINVEPLSEFPTDEDTATTSTIRVEKNDIPRPDDFDQIERHEMVAKDSIYDIPNSHPVEMLSSVDIGNGLGGGGVANGGGLHSFFPGMSFLKNHPIKTEDEIVASLSSSPPNTQPSQNPSSFSKPPFTKLSLFSRTPSSKSLESTDSQIPSRSSSSISSLPIRHPEHVEQHISSKIYTLLYPPLSTIQREAFKKIFLKRKNISSSSHRHVCFRPFSIRSFLLAVGKILVAFNFYTREQKSTNGKTTSGEIFFKQSCSSGPST